ncbi:MAG: SDR family NAD(P)-dependent oxidoreductase [Stenotrophobium sp.]
MYVFQDKVAVVTGAGSGIGRALAELLARKGCKLALADINETGLADTAARIGTPVLTRKLDVSDRAAFEAFAKEVEAHYGRADLIFNNAGVALLQPVQEMRYEDLEWLMGINFWGVIHGTHAFLPSMLARKSGVIVNVSSLYGLIGWPANGAYCAAKFAVRGYTEVMRQDLRGTGVQVACVHPGGIKTNIVRNARFTSDDLGRKDKSVLVKDFDRIAITTPEKAAQTIVVGVERGRERILIGPDAKLIDRLQRWMPESYPAVIRWLERRLR